MENKTTQDLFLCDCFSTDHQMIFSYDQSEDWNRIFVHVHLSQDGNFWTRLKRAVKYLFGHRSKYGDFDEFIFKPGDAYKLQKAATYLKKCKE